jgi:hypothetical protein
LADQMNYSVRRGGPATHCVFDPALPAAVTVDPGQSVRVETVHAFARLPDGPAFEEAVSRMDLGDGNPLSGPIAVRGAEPGDTIVVSSDWGKIALPLVLAELPDRVVWVPTNSPGAKVSHLAVPAGAVVRIARRTTSTLLGEAS